MIMLTEIRKNIISIISLVIAISALSYNTYRNELTEINRNTRNASFEVLKELNQLQLLIDYSYYDKNAEQGNPIEGWAHVNYIDDMSQLISKTVIAEAKNLSDVWKDNWKSVNEQENSNKKITAGINKLRLSIREAIKALR